MDVICDYVAATRSDTVGFSHIEMKQELSESLLERQIRKISFDTNRIINPVIHCSHWLSMIAYLKKKCHLPWFFLWNKESWQVWKSIFLLSMTVWEIKVWTLLQPNTSPPQIDGSSSGMHAILNVWYLLHIGETYNKSEILVCKRGNE